MCVLLHIKIVNTISLCVKVCIEKIIKPNLIQTPQSRHLNYLKTHHSARAIHLNALH